MQQGREMFYGGDIASTAFSRSSQHSRGLRGWNADNVLHAHILTDHRGAQLEEKNFEMVVERSHKSITYRQVGESILITKKLDERDDNNILIILNSKNQFHQPRAVKAAYSREVKY